MNCRKCNNEISESVTMCPFCGTSVRMPESEPLPMQDNSSNINIPVAGPIKQMPNNDATPLMEPIKPINSNLNTSYNNESKNNKKTIIFLILGLLLIGIITFIIFRFVIPNSNTNEPVTPVEPDVVEETIIGSDEIGYLALPGDWYEYEPEDSTIMQYINDDGFIVYLESSDIVNEALTAKKQVETAYTYLNDDVNIEKAEMTQEKVADYDAYKLVYYRKDDKKWLIEWYFEAGNEKIYYISIEGPSLKSDYLAIPDTFSLTEIE